MTKKNNADIETNVVITTLPTEKKKTTTAKNCDAIVVLSLSVRRTQSYCAQSYSFRTRKGIFIRSFRTIERKGHEKEINA
mmetsp:Transcript_35533/g.82487  ORF Transcript_35533/g.82487 Transcript_35533/m.82487 type:complete len:80 (-) Transcript_35533:164-403(-)